MNALEVLLDFTTQIGNIGNALYTIFFYEIPTKISLNIVGFTYDFYWINIPNITWSGGIPTFNLAQPTINSFQLATIFLTPAVFVTLIILKMVKAYIPIA